MTTERWAIVPAEATSAMISAGWESGKRVGDTRIINSVSGVWGAMIQASPGAALLAEVLAARDAVTAAPRHSNEEDAALIRLFAALDKLGPAAEGAT